MELLVCFKIAPDLDMLFAHDVDMVGNEIDSMYCKKSLNPYDESALELALKLRDTFAARDEEISLGALTIGTGDADRTLKTLLALRYDCAVRIDCASDLRFRPMFVANKIADYVQQFHPYPVIVMGEQSSEGNNAKTPLLVAELLNIPCIPSVTGIRLSSTPGCLSVTTRNGECIGEYTVAPPVVLAVGNVPDSYIRIPTLRDRMNVKTQVELIAGDDPRFVRTEGEEECELVELFAQERGRQCAFLEGDVREQAETLWKTFLKDWAEQ